MSTVPLSADQNNPHSIIIPITQGKFVIVSPEDADLQASKWHLSKCYAKGRVDGRLVAMHRLILERKLQRPIQDEMMADHINGNQLDNRRCNLREVTLTQNARNSKVQKNNTTGFTGVSRTKYGYYIARIGSEGKLLGVFEEALDASFCYDREAYLRWGEYARLNHPLEEVLAWQEPPRHLNTTNTSGYRGVTRIKRSGKWQASYRHNEKLLHLGTYGSPEVAARAYDRKAIEINGRDALTNFPIEDYEAS